jgi:hypothetical protein
LATANTTKIRPSGISTIAVRNLRMIPLLLLKDPMARRPETCGFRGQPARDQ